MPLANAYPTTVYMRVETFTSPLALYNGSNTHVVEYVTSGSILVNKEINTIEVWLRKTGNPTGTITVGVFDSLLNTKKVFALVDATSLTTAWKRYTFTIPDPYIIQYADHIGISYSGGDASNYVQIATDTTNPFGGINTYRKRYAGSWFDATNDDLMMTLAYVVKEHEFNVDKAYSYIIAQYNPTLQLVRENESINRYWLWTDNILASHVLKEQHIAISAKITSKIKEYATNYQLQFRHPIAALFNQPAYFKPITDTNITGNIWASISNSTGEDLACSDYADIAFLKTIHYYRSGQYKEAKACYEHGVSMFDGYGFVDNAFYADGEKYTTYKLALWKIASDITGYGQAKEALKIIAIMQDDTTGGVYTHYKKDMSIDSMTNVETTALAIMAYSQQQQEQQNTDSSKWPLEYYIVIGAIIAGAIAIFLRR